MRRRAVITGIGVVTPLATGVSKSWEALCAGKSGVGRISRFDPTGQRTQIAAEVKDFNAEDFVEKKWVRRMDPYIHFALAASTMAIEDSQFKITSHNAERVGVIIGTAVGGVPTLEKNHRFWVEGKPHEITPFFIPGMITNMAAGQVSIRFGAKGPNFAPTTACAASTHSIGDAFRLIQGGYCDAVIAGGAEASISPTLVVGMGKMAATSVRNGDPEKACRPFEKDRDGFVTGEGSGVLILEELQSALSRGAKIYAEVIGYAANSDAYHITSPAPRGDGAMRCMRLALKDACINCEEVDYINAHGTSTVLNDLRETMAIKTVFGEYSKKLLISSNKSMLGHLWGASGAVEAIFTCLTIGQGIIPPTINYETPDPECDLDYVPNTARKAEVRIAISNSFGFGGTNGVLVFRGYND